MPARQHASMQQCAKQTSERAANGSGLCSFQCGQKKKGAAAFSQAGADTQATISVAGADYTDTKAAILVAGADCTDTKAAISVSGAACSV